MMRQKKKNGRHDCIFSKRNMTLVCITDASVNQFIYFYAKHKQKSMRQAEASYNPSSKTLLE